jgi:hypothetical protein
MSLNIHERHITLRILESLESVLGETFKRTTLTSRVRDRVEIFSRIGEAETELLLSVMVLLKSLPSRFKVMGSFNVNEPNLRFSWVGVFSNLSH